MPIPARSIPTPAGAESLSTGTSTELDTHGREAALWAPTLIREDRTQRGKCCVSSSSIRSPSSQIRISPFLARLWWCRVAQLPEFFGRSHPRLLSADLETLRISFTYLLH